MSAKKPSQSNTLLNYFFSPINSNKSVNKSVSTVPIQSSTNKKPSQKNSIESDDEDVPQPKKRQRTALFDSESDSENDSRSANSHKNQTKDKSIKKRKTTPDHDRSGGGSSKVSKITEDSLKDQFKFQKATNNGDSCDLIAPENGHAQIKSTSVAIPDVDNQIWLHEKLEFLKPEKIRDIQKRRPDHLDYDSRTLHVPDDFLSKCTPAMRQWWILKREHMDAVLFFKVGKFYELYHMDATVGVRHLGFSYMKGEFAHSGFPESAYAKMATALVDKGFKVARVEQTETPEMMNERCTAQKSSKKFDKVVKRELCQVSTRATCVYSAQVPDARSDMSCYLHAIAVKKSQDGNCRFGICFVDTSIGTFYLSEFDDDRCCSRLLTLLAEYPPGLILTEKGSNVSIFSELLNTYFKDVPKEALTSKSQFYNASTTLEKLSSECYFHDKDGHFKWPSVFKEVADDCVPKQNFELSLRALGACMWFLKDSQLDIQVLSMGKFQMYQPPDLSSNTRQLARDYLVLDSVTLQNLSLLGGKGTLQKTLDHCQTPFGKRLMPQWICRPLCDVAKIKARQEAVNELWNNPGLLRLTQDILKTLPDLERQVAKIHAYGNKFCATNHPDSRAIFYEAKTYSKRKIMDLLRTLRGFEKAQEIEQLFNGCESRLLRKITQFQPVGLNIDLTSSIQFFKEAFDQQEAEKEGKIIPKRGVDDDFDRIEERIAEINRDLNDYLKEQCDFFGCKVSYFGTDKKRFQIEVPEHRTSRVTREYMLEGTKKGSKAAKRYSTATTKMLLQDMLKAEAERAKIVLDLNRRIFEKFSQRQEQWEQVIHCLTTVDVLCSLAEFARTYSQDICVPVMKPMAEQPEISIEEGRHPCILNIDKFVPNDTQLGVDDYASIIILTGPNMGGKSTLMRQVATICIMAQMGCCVPAAKCELTLIDRIFTRIGARDDIVQGQSTFFVELNEASAILKHATKNSLVLVDELGRGTSTHDGNAIATAYVQKVIEIQCRTLFSTHYHSLVDHFIGRKDVQLGHMACMVENDDDPTTESVTLLYKMVDGRCPKSYGFNAARLAGLNKDIITRARCFAKELEDELTNRNIFRKIFATSDVLEIKNCLANLSIA